MGKKFESVFRSLMLAGALLPLAASAFTPIELIKGWNLVGNSDTTPIEVGDKLSGTQIITVWKWDQSGKWAFYTPTMTSTQLEAYAQSKDYVVLSSIASKEGFWVNANSAATIQDLLATPPEAGTATVSLSAGDLKPSWNLVSSADKKTPSELNVALAASLNASSKSISTLWAWDAPNKKWKFYAPTLESNGSLASYIANKQYAAFTGVLDVTEGFWVNIGSATPIATPPSPSGSLRNVRYTSANDWYFRVGSSNSAQNTPAVDGSTRWHDTRTAKKDGEPYSWVVGSSPVRGSDLHWNGSAWVNCLINSENTTSAPDADGNTTYSYCQGWETGSSVGDINTVSDVSAQRMIDVYNEIRTAGYTNFDISSASTVLGDAVFPTNSMLRLRTSAGNYQTTPGYYPGLNNRVSQTDDLKVGAGDPTACNQNPFPSPKFHPTLESMIAMNQGKPCIYSVHTFIGAGGVSLSSGTRNESWGDTTVSLGTIGTEPTYSDPLMATAYYTGNVRLRVAFDVGNAVKYYSCQERWSGSTRNCDPIGTGTYSIQTVGNARTLTFDGYPAAADSLKWRRVFVERNGYIYYGYLDTPNSSKQARLNLTGLNALFDKLGLPAFNPETPIVLSFGSYSGAYSGSFSGSDSGTVEVTVKESGSATCSGTSTAVGAFTCTVTLTPKGSDGTTADFNAVTTTGAVLTGSVNYYTGIVAGTWSNGSSTGAFSGARR